jgi:L-asparaginase
MPRPKIAVLYVGGSIGMVRNQKTGRIEQLESLFEIHRFLPEIQKEVAIQFFTLANVMSTEIQPSHWIEMARTIEKHYDGFEGFVIIHGTNTMSYTAAALSFALQNLSKPVIMTGALIPVNDLSSDGRSNLVLALRAAQLDLAEVAIVMGSTILRGSRAQKVEQSILKTFDSPKFPPLGEFNTSVHLSPQRVVRRKRKLSCKPTFETDVVFLTIHPGIQESFFQAVLQAHPKGVVLGAYGSGLLSDRLFPWLRTLKERGIPVLITSQSLRGAIDLNRYRKQLMLEELGVISGKNMTPECAVVKFMWALTQTKVPSRLQEIMERNLSGELDE